MNEGHAAFLSMARLEYLTKERGCTVEQALEILPRCSVFTTHTPVPAGNEYFSVDLLRPHLHTASAIPGWTLKPCCTSPTLRTSRWGTKYP
jgi:glycogen phosphorylase